MYLSTIQDNILRYRPHRFLDQWLHSPVVVGHVLDAPIVYDRKLIDFGAGDWRFLVAYRKRRKQGTRIRRIIRADSKRSASVVLNTVLEKFGGDA